MKSVVFLPILFLAILLASFPVFAANTRSISITANKVSILGDEDLTLTASPSGFIDGESVIIKVAFFQPATSNYFGYTNSGDAWIKNSTATTNQRAIVIGQWDGTLVVKSDFSDSGYKGEGEYSLKVRFYYGPTPTPDWSNTLAITINEADPTPTSTPLPTNTSTPTPTATSAPTPTSLPTISAPTPTQTPINTPTPTAKNDDILDGASIGFLSEEQEEDVLGDFFSSYSGVATPSSLAPLTTIIPLLFVGVGTLLLSVVYVIQKKNP